MTKLVIKEISCEQVDFIVVAHYLSDKKWRNVTCSMLLCNEGLRERLIQVYRATDPRMAKAFPRSPKNLFAGLNIDWFTPLLEHDVRFSAEEEFSNYIESIEDQFYAWGESYASLWDMFGALDAPIRTRPVVQEAILASYTIDLEEHKKKYQKITSVKDEAHFNEIRKQFY